STGRRRSRKVQIGSKSSDAYLVAYDKGLETETAEEGEWIRWELRLSDEQANEFVTEFFADNSHATSGDFRSFVAKAKSRSGLLCYDHNDCRVFESDVAPELDEKFKRLALSALKSRLSFRDRKDGLNISRAAVLPWWESFLEYFDPEAEFVDSDPDAGLSEGARFASNMASIPDWPEAKDEKVIKMRQACEKAEELLTEIFEEHIRHALPNWLDDIPDYQEDDRYGGLGDADDPLVYVGLVPVSGAAIFRFPMTPIGRTKQTGMRKTERCNVIPFPVCKRDN
ncbi:MAG: replication initiation factor domain-containing protein, partial [Azonexus sp.]|nr:replication initiation factor domain-containing protein [Azonexus sp.]